MNALSPGNRVMLGSGLFGTVVSVGPKQVVLEIVTRRRADRAQAGDRRIVTEADDETCGRARRAATSEDAVTAGRGRRGAHEPTAASVRSDGADQRQPPQSLP